MTDKTEKEITANLKQVLDDLSAIQRQTEIINQNAERMLKLVMADQNGTDTRQ